MRTISQAVETVLDRSPFYSEALSEGIANNAEIARKIRPAVEELLLEKVSESAIAMALHRIGKRISKTDFGTKMLKHMSDITVRSNLIAFSLPNAAESAEFLEVVARSAKKHKDSFFNYSRGLHESLLIVSHDLEQHVEAVLKGARNIKRKAGLSAITMKLPEQSLAVPGVYYPILKAIALEGISLVEVMSVLREFSILFEDKDVDRAFSIIKRITS